MQDSSLPKNGPETRAAGGFPAGVEKKSTPPAGAAVMDFTLAPGTRIRNPVASMG
jgi:hypothetical protein